MKQFILAALLACNAVVYCAAQTKTTGAAQHVVLAPDSTTVYYDEQHRQISDQEFSDKVSSGHYHFVPVVSNGKLVSMQLKKVNGSMQLGAPLPAFNFTALDGKTYDLSKLKGKTLVLNFWFVACTPCRMEVPELNALVKKYEDNPDIVFIAITRDSAGVVQKFLKTAAFNYTIAAGQSKLVENYGIGGYPTNVVVAKDGSVAFELTSYGPENIQKLDAAIETLSKM